MNNRIHRAAGGIAGALLAAALLPAYAHAQTTDKDADARARATEARMRDAERVRLTHSVIALPLPGTHIPPGVPLGAGYVEGIDRLGVPALKETDAGLGVAYLLGLRKDGATALPSGLAMGATWDPGLVRAGGEMIASEARAKGFNVLLAGGINLVRDPRGGRDFEYFSEDPLLAGLLGGAQVAGVQSRRVLSTVKHFVLNDSETGRHFHDAVIAEPALRMSDLLAFQIAIERGRPGAVMCAYNKVNGADACGSRDLLTRVLKRDWRYPGFVMSDWGATAGLQDAAAGLDQQSGEQLDAKPFLGASLLTAAAKDGGTRARLADMNRRVLRSIYAVGLDAPAPTPTPVDVAADAALAQRIAEAGIVLLRNRSGALPLAASARRIAVIGSHADIGVLSGGGSSQTEGAGGPVVSLPVQGQGSTVAILTQNYQRSSPLKAISAQVPGAHILYRNGRYISDAVEAARRSDVAIVFATQWTSEGMDAPDLSLPDGQDALIDAVASANANTIVVLETGSGVAMPWLGKTAAVVEAWYPGAHGGEAIARVLFGQVNPSGRLPVTFAVGVDQLPRPALPGAGTVELDVSGRGKLGDALTINYDIEGADVGYRWFARTGRAPLFPFGFGLSYTRFERGELAMTPGTATVASFTTRNVGARAGADVAQLYLTATPDGPVRRLVGFARLDLAPGESRAATVPIDPRLLADWKDESWRIAGGTYRFALGASATDLGPEVTVRLSPRRWR